MYEQLSSAIDQLRINAGRYAQAERYYAGKHNLAFASEKFRSTFGSLFREFAMNLCPAICDALRDRLKISGFSVADDNGRSLAAAARQIWHRNRMDLRAGEVHKTAVLCGDAYVVVWPDDSGEVAIYPHKPANVCVFYDEAAPGRVTLAAKCWRQPDGRVRINIFFRDRVERYISLGTSELAVPDVRSFVPTADGIAENPFGVVPVFHFANNGDIGSYGISELEPAIPIQDGLNKAVLDMLVAMEFSAYRQRWAVGIEYDVDTDGKPMKPFNSGVEHLWITDNPNARFGDFAAADLEQFLKVKDGFRMDMASVTGTPLYYLMPQIKGIPSGESLKKAETRFIGKVRDRQASFGQVWADVMSFALKAKGVAADAEIAVRWEDATQLSDRERLENILLKRRIGLSADDALAEAGYLSSETDTSR